MNRYADKQATRKLLLPQFPLTNFNSLRPQKGESCRWPLVSLCHVFFVWFLDWFYKNEGMRTRHQTVFYIMNIREFQLSWQKGFVNIYGKKKNWNQWTCLISFFPPYLYTASLSSRKWPANFGFCSVFVVSIHLLKSFFNISKTRNLRFSIDSYMYKICHSFNAVIWAILQGDDIKIDLDLWYLRPANWRR